MLRRFPGAPLLRRALLLAMVAMLASSLPAAPPKPVG